MTARVSFGALVSVRPSGGRAAHRGEGEGEGEGAQRA